MVNISGSIYLNSEVDKPSLAKPMMATSAGNLKLVNKNFYRTHRPKGRRDYQLLYIADGCGKYYVNGEYIKVKKGNIVIYYPFEKQEYEYNNINGIDIYWVHFTGDNVLNHLAEFGFTENKIFDVTEQNVYIFLFESIIKELQLKRQNYTELVNTYFYELLILMSRNVFESKGMPDKENVELVKEAVQLLNFHYYNEFSVAEYAKQHNISVCWFTRIFKKSVGETPLKYLLNIRINKAKELLISSGYNITEISEIVGYQNPLYFSRLFKKYTGKSPTEYRKSPKSIINSKISRI